MNELGDMILADLRAYADELLERGLAPGQRATSAGAQGGRTLSAVTRRVEALVQVLPALLSELDVLEDPAATVLHAVRTPVRARLSRRPGDFEWHEGRLLPRLWAREVPLQRRDTEPLRWLQHLVDEVRGDLSRLDRRYAKWIDDAVQARQGESGFARAEVQELEAMAARITKQREQLERICDRIRRTAGGRVVARATVPALLPTSPAWNALRRIAREVTRDTLQLGERLGEWLAHPLQLADLPHLYQRWCGMRLVQALERMGWRRTTDALGPLFLGGCIRFHHDGVVIELWVEPRITESGEHPCGLRATRGEATPDYVLCTPGSQPLGGRTGESRRGRDFFVLDPTLSIDPGVLADKGRKYLARLMTSEVRLVAGRPTYVGPLRAWAAAPLDSPAARLLPAHLIGTLGALPLHPARSSDRALEGWLGDVTAHALAWGRPTSAA